MNPRFGCKLAALAVLAVAAFGALYFTAFPADSSVTSDDGAYALETAALQAGQWNVEYAFADADPGFVAVPYRGTHADNRFYTLSKTPAWLAAGGVGRGVAGIAGQRAVAVAGAALAVAVTGLLGLRVGGKGVGALAAVLAATSPILFNGLQLWAHSMAAAGVGIVVIGLLMAQVDRRVLAGTLLAVGGAAIAAAVRSDGVAVILGIVAVTGLRSVIRRDWPVLISTGAVGAATLGTQLASSLFVREVSGAGTLAGAARPRARDWSDPIDGAVHTLVSELQAYRGAYLAIIAAVLLTGYATYLMRLARYREATVALGVAGALWIARTILYAGDAATGLLAAWPVVIVAALVAERWRSDREVLWLGCVSVAAAMVVVAGQSRIGGGFNWGGRYLSSLLPVLAVLVAVALEPHLRAGGWRRIAGVSFVALAGVTCVASLAFDLNHRLRHDETISVVERADAGVPVIVETNVLPMLAWRTYGEIDWLVVPTEEDGGVEQLRVILSDSGVDRVTLFRVTDATAEALAGEVVDTADRPVTVALPSG